MRTSGGVIAAGEALAVIGDVLDRLDPDRAGLGAAERLALVRASRRVRGRLDALTSVLTSEAERAGAAEDAAGTGLASWLGIGETVSRREAAGAVRQARELAGHGLLAQAAVAGRVSVRQARAITGVLDGLSGQLDPAQQERAEEVLLDVAGHLDADQLARATGQVLASVAPADAEELLEVRLQREAEAAQRQRSLRFFFEGASVRFDGSLPRREAEAWIARLDGHAEHARRTAIEGRDPLATMPTMEQRRADALIAMIHLPAGAGAGPATQVFVQLDPDRLAEQLTGKGTLADGQPLSAGELRRACCDAEIIPVVLGGPSGVLDVGRAQRLVTPELRAALIARDRGCVFPGCDAPPQRCEAHHILAWLHGGVTALYNLVLLCHTHHPVIEPARHTIRDQWQVRLGDDGLPEFLPPARIDPQRQPLRHTRHPPPPASRASPPPAA